MAVVATVVTARSSFARVKSVLEAIQASKSLELKLIVGGSLVHQNFGRSDLNFIPHAEIHSVVMGDAPGNMARTVGLSLIELTQVLDDLRPDVVLTVADRYETLANAIAASYSNIPVAHIQGGEHTGSIDGKVRHAVTQLSDLHFPATLAAGDYLVNRQGVPASNVFVVGCPSIDLIPDDVAVPINPTTILQGRGSGATIGSGEPYAIVMYHADTTDQFNTELHLAALLPVVQSLPMKSIWLWPNVDSGHDHISKFLRSAREKLQRTRFVSNVPPEDFYRLLYHARVLIGNSSVGLRECAYLGTPVVNIGFRQENREHGDNVINELGATEKTLRAAVEKQITHERYPSSQLYGYGGAGVRIAQVLEEHFE